MKLLTKKWAEEYEQLRVIHWLKDFDAQQEDYEQIKKRSRDDYFHSIAADIVLAKAVLNNNLAEDFYQAKVNRDRKVLLSLPREVYSKIKDIKTLVLGYACQEDKTLLMSYASELRIKLEKLSNTANEITEIAQDYLPEEFCVDDFVGELVYEEYINGKNYVINIGGYEICIENYFIIEREDFKINEWEENNPLTLWTSLHAAELHYITDKCYELHLLLVDGDKFENMKFWNFTLRGTNIKYLNTDLD